MFPEAGDKDMKTEDSEMEGTKAAFHLEGLEGEFMAREEGEGVGVADGEIEEDEMDRTTP